ncbi:MAG: Plug domain-containing protein, partial [Pseudomonadota bacterium]|nr:Plug domain-containing protein [Pseudomonadota bacterium]
MSMRQTVTRSLLLSAVAWSALGGAALAQTLAQTGPGRPAQVDDVIVTATPYGVTQRATTIATDVLDDQALAIAPATSLGDLVNGLPGVRSTVVAPGASRPVIRGLSGPRGPVLTNGLGQIDASSVSPD